jgi:NAD(P)-dependent dehydrogenase (short-subunit alcohol dehydrogenase family)
MSAPMIILGAHGGIGEALVRRLLSDGQSVIATARDAQNLCELASLGARSITVDVTKPEDIETLIAGADSGEGIAGIAYCIGSIVLKPLKATQDADFLTAYDVNVLGALRVLKRAEKSLRVAKGSVVLFSTIAVQQGFTNHTVIASAKGAVEGLTRSLAAEWAPDIRVNCIAPSLTQSAMAAPLLSSAPMREAIEKMHPIPRIGTPEDSAVLAAYLLGNDSTWMTGQILHVDGGRSALRVKG